MLAEAKALPTVRSKMSMSNNSFSARTLTEQSAIVMHQTLNGLQLYKSLVHRLKRQYLPS